jgi:hypothetical protein
MPQNNLLIPEKIPNQFKPNLITGQNNIVPFERNPALKAINEPASIDAIANTITGALNIGITEGSEENWKEKAKNGATRLLGWTQRWIKDRVGIENKEILSGKDITSVWKSLIEPTSEFTKIEVKDENNQTQSFSGIEAILKSDNLEDLADNALLKLCEATVSESENNENTKLRGLTQIASGFNRWQVLDELKKVSENSSYTSEITQKIKSNILKALKHLKNQYKTFEVASKAGKLIEEKENLHKTQVQGGENTGLFNTAGEVRGFYKLFSKDENGKIRFNPRAVLKGVSSLVNRGVFSPLFSAITFGSNIAAGVGIAEDQQKSIIGLVQKAINEGKSEEEIRRLFTLGVKESLGKEAKKFSYDSKENLFKNLTSGVKGFLGEFMGSGTIAANSKVGVDALSYLKAQELLQEAIDAGKVISIGQSIDLLAKEASGSSEKPVSDEALLEEIDAFAKQSSLFSKDTFSSVEEFKNRLNKVVCSTVAVAVQGTALAFLAQGVGNVAKGGAQLVAHLDQQNESIVGKTSQHFLYDIGLGSVATNYRNWAGLTSEVNKTEFTRTNGQKVEVAVGALHDKKVLESLKNEDYKLFNNGDAVIAIKGGNIEDIPNALLALKNNNADPININSSDLKSTNRNNIFAFNEASAPQIEASSGFSGNLMVDKSGQLYTLSGNWENENSSGGLLTKIDSSDFKVLDESNFGNNLITGTKIAELGPQEIKATAVSTNSEGGDQKESYQEESASLPPSQDYYSESTEQNSYEPQSPAYDEYSQAPVPKEYDSYVEKSYSNYDSYEPINYDKAPVVEDYQPPAQNYDYQETKYESPNSNYQKASYEPESAESAPETGSSRDYYDSQEAPVVENSQDVVTNSIDNDNLYGGQSDDNLAQNPEPIPQVDPNGYTDAIPVVEADSSQVPVREETIIPESQTTPKTSESVENLDPLVEPTETQETQISPSLNQDPSNFVPTSEPQTPSFEDPNGYQTKKIEEETVTQSIASSDKSDSKTTEKPPQRGGGRTGFVENNQEIDISNSSNVANMDGIIVANNTSSEEILGGVGSDNISSIGGQVPVWDVSKPLNNNIASSTASDSKIETSLGEYSLSDLKAPDFVPQTQNNAGKIGISSDSKLNTGYFQTLRSDIAPTLNSKIEYPKVALDQTVNGLNIPQTQRQTVNISSQVIAEERKPINLDGVNTQQALTTKASAEKSPTLDSKIEYPRITVNDRLQGLGQVVGQPPTLNSNIEYPRVGLTQTVNGLNISETQRQTSQNPTQTTHSQRLQSLGQTSNNSNPNSLFKNDAEKLGISSSTARLLLNNNIDPRSLNTQQLGEIERANQKYGNSAMLAAEALSPKANPTNSETATSFEGVYNDLRDSNLPKSAATKQILEQSKSSDAAQKLINQFRQQNQAPSTTDPKNTVNNSNPNLRQVSTTATNAFSDSDIVVGGQGNDNLLGGNPESLTSQIETKTYKRSELGQAVTRIQQPLQDGETIKIIAENGQILEIKNEQTRRQIVEDARTGKIKIPAIDRVEISTKKPLQEQTLSGEQPKIQVAGSSAVEGLSLRNSTEPLKSNETAYKADVQARLAEIEKQALGINSQRRELQGSKDPIATQKLQELNQQEIKLKQEVDSINQADRNVNSQETQANNNSDNLERRFLALETERMSLIGDPKNANRVAEIRTQQENLRQQARQSTQTNSQNQSNQIPQTISPITNEQVEIVRTQAGQKLQQLEQEHQKLENQKASANTEQLTQIRLQQTALEQQANQINEQINEQVLAIQGRANSQTNPTLNNLANSPRAVNVSNTTTLQSSTGQRTWNAQTFLETGSGFEGTGGEIKRTAIYSEPINFVANPELALKLQNEGIVNPGTVLGQLREQSASSYSAVQDIAKRVSKGEALDPELANTQLPNGLTYGKLQEFLQKNPEATKALAQRGINNSYVVNIDSQAKEEFGINLIPIPPINNISLSASESQQVISMTNGELRLINLPKTAFLPKDNTALLSYSQKPEVIKNPDGSTEVRTPIFNLTSDPVNDPDRIIVNYRDTVSGKGNEIAVAINVKYMREEQRQRLLANPSEALDVARLQNPSAFTAFPSAKDIKPSSIITTKTGSYDIFEVLDDTAKYYSFNKSVDNPNTSDAAASYTGAFNAFLANPNISYEQKVAALNKVLSYRPLENSPEGVNQSILGLQASFRRDSLTTAASENGGGLLARYDKGLPIYPQDILSHVARTGGVDSIAASIKALEANQNGTGGKDIDPQRIKVVNELLGINRNVGESLSSRESSSIGFNPFGKGLTFGSEKQETYNLVDPNTGKPIAGIQEARDYMDSPEYQSGIKRDSSNFGFVAGFAGIPFVIPTGSLDASKTTPVANTLASFLYQGPIGVIGFSEKQSQAVGGSSYDFGELSKNPNFVRVSQNAELYKGIIQNATGDPSFVEEYNRLTGKQGQMSSQEALTTALLGKNQRLEVGRTYTIEVGGKTYENLSYEQAKDVIDTMKQAIVIQRFTPDNTVNTGTGVKPQNIQTSLGGDFSQFGGVASVDIKDYAENFTQDVRNSLEYTKQAVLESHRNPVPDLSNAEKTTFGELQRQNGGNSFAGYMIVRNNAGGVKESGILSDLNPNERISIVRRWTGLNGEKFVQGYAEFCNNDLVVRDINPVDARITSNATVLQGANEVKLTGGNIRSSEYSRETEISGAGTPDRRTPEQPKPKTPQEPVAPTPQPPEVTLPPQEQLPPFNPNAPTPLPPGQPQIPGTPVYQVPGAPVPTPPGVNLPPQPPQFTPAPNVDLAFPTVPRPSPGINPGVPQVPQGQLPNVTLPGQNLVRPPVPGINPGVPQVPQGQLPNVTLPGQNLVRPPVPGINPGVPVGPQSGISPVTNLGGNNPVAPFGAIKTPNPIGPVGGLNNAVNLARPAPLVAPFGAIKPVNPFGLVGR